MALAVAALFSASALAQGRPWASKVPKELVKKANPAPANAESIEKGKTVYLNTCLPCHGEGAQGDGPAAQFIVPPPKPLLVNGKLAVPPGVAFWVITHGIDGTGMAALADVTTEPERWMVLRYIESMAAPVANTASPAVTPGAPAPTPATAGTPLPIASPLPSPAPTKKPAK